MMERKKRDQKIVSATGHEPDSNDLLSNEEQNQPNVASATMSMGATSPSNDNVPSLNQQDPSVLQWPYASQNTLDQPASTSKPCISSQSPPSGAVNQWHPLPHLPLNLANQQGQMPPHLAQSFTSFWLPHQRPGYHLPVANAPAIFQPFNPLGAISANWQTSSLGGCGTSSKDHPQVPNFCNPVYTYPGFPGPWDLSAWWGQVQLSQPPSTYTFPGSYGYSSSQPPMMPGCPTSIGQSSQRGIIRPLAKLSQKHQQLWEAQSAENVHLWTVIGQLQSDTADYKSRMMKLEAEVSSLKQAIEEPAAPSTGTAVSGQPSKRGRPRRSTASFDALPSLDESQPRTRGRKPKSQIFEKVVLNKVENKVKPANTASITRQGEEKVSNASTNNISGSGISGINVMMPLFPCQVHQENTQMQMCGVDLSTSLKMKNNEDEIADARDALAILAQEAKGMDHRTALASCHASRNNGGLGWPYAIPSEGSGRNILNMTSQGFHNNGNVVEQGEKIIHGWGLVNEEDASNEREDTMAASAKDDNEEEMGDDGSSGGEEIACSKGKNLPQFSNW